MAQTTIDRLIINPPYDEPSKHWRYDRETRSFSIVPDRRPAGYIVASEGSKTFDDPGVFVEIPLVNRIRTRVSEWREAGYPGVTSITSRLLGHWRNPEEFDTRRFFFCQLEAIETLIWFTEAPTADRVGIEVPSDGGDFDRLCCKMATGAGKTLVMSMAIAWHILNKVTYPRDLRFSKNVLVIAPGLTVKSRLEVLKPSASDNYYQAFSIVPPASIEKLRQGRVRVDNWHALSWDTDQQIEKKRTVDKRGPKSDAAYARDVLGDLASKRNLLVINDEAHHAWRVKPDALGKYLRRRETKESAQEATVWVGGLDRLHRSRGILKALDFSATPFAPSGRRSTQEALFDWIVSDFGLNDAIEAGLVKTPRVVIRDDAVPDAKTYKSRLYHIYNDPEVRDDLNRKAQAQDPLPDLVINAYYLLGFDWREAMISWEQSRLPTPPVMITVCNRTETAARVKHAFDNRKIHIDELSDPERILHIDSKVLARAEAMDEPPPSSASEPIDEFDEISDEPIRKLTKTERAEQLRLMVDTVGQPGEPGGSVQNVISVGMLSEGWDAKTVTHIMGLRAFTSQLLCEQVIGRGLRRMSYELKAMPDPLTGNDVELMEPEYVNVFGVPFTFLPHEGGEGLPPPPPSPKTIIEPDPAKEQYAIRWPNVVRIDRVFRPELRLDWELVEQLELDAARTAQVAEMAPILEGKPDATQIDSIELERLAGEFRTQRIIFETARDVYEQMESTWSGSKEQLMAQLVGLVEEFIRSDKIAIHPPLFFQDDLRRRLIITLNMNKVVQHIWDAIRFENADHLEPVFDRDRPIRSTGDMVTWYTGKPCERTEKSHINLCVFDGAWEASDEYVLDKSPDVSAWAKNDHLGFDILYVYRGVVHKYRPDFLIRMSNGDMLVLETKGRDTERDQVKRRFLDEWVRAVNTHGGFGNWAWDVSLRPGEIKDILIRHLDERGRDES